MGIWDKIKGAVSGTPAPASTPGASPAGEAPADSGMLKRLRGMMPQVKSMMKNPALVARMKQLQERMEKDGVDPNNEAQVKSWVESHKAELQGESGAPKPETFVRETPKIGRNDPCGCGSGKKYKKCCGQSA